MAKKKGAKSSNKISKKKSEEDLVFPAFPVSNKKSKSKKAKSSEKVKTSNKFAKQVIKEKTSEIKQVEKVVKAERKLVEKERKLIESKHKKFEKKYDNFVKYDKIAKDLVKGFDAMGKEFKEYKAKFEHMADKKDFEKLQKDVKKEVERINKTKESITKDVLLLSNIKKQIDSKMEDLTKFRNMLNSKMEVFDKMIEKDMELNKSNKSFVGETRKVVANLQNVSKLHTQAHATFRENFSSVDKKITSLNNKLDDLEKQLNSAVGYLRNLGGAFNKFVSESKFR